MRRLGSRLYQSGVGPSVGVAEIVHPSLAEVAAQGAAVPLRRPGRREGRAFYPSPLSAAPASPSSVTVGNA